MTIVDPSLRLLMRLRTRGMLRRWRKAVARPRGIVLTVITALLFVPWFFSIGMSLWMGIKAPVEPIRRVAAPGMFLFTAVALLFTAGEQALYFSPAEVGFLFPGPYRKRQLLAYKMAVTVALSVFSAMFFTLASATMSPHFYSAFVGSFLIVLFFQALQMATGLAGSTLGALAWSRGRRVLMVGLVVAVVLAFGSALRGINEATALETARKIEASTTARVVLAPFRWFVMAFTAENPLELLTYALPCLAIDAALIAAVFALDASYLEAASTASAKRFARMQKLMGGGGGVRAGARKTGRFRFRPPAAPWWGGVGPNLWRQMTTALGSPTRLLGLMAMLLALPIVMGIVAGREPKAAQTLTYFSQGMVIWMSIAVSGLLPYDFRGDIDVMESLKALPIPPTRLALGQLITPALVATVAQATAVAATMAFMGGGADLSSWAILAFLAPVNLMFYAVENLLFLWYPSRMVAGQFDVIAVGRQMLFLLAKVLALAVGAGIAAGLGVAAYFAIGRNINAALAVAWIALFGSALALVPLVGRAFVQFDVARDIPA